MKNLDFNKIRVFQRISKTGFIFILPCFSLFSYGQSTELTLPDKNNQPDVHVNVNREVDKNGNVIRYDSTYTWSWSSDGSQPIPQNFMNDSDQDIFFRFFNNQDFSDDKFMNPFGNNVDSSFSHNFNDFYFENIEKDIQEMMQRQQQLMNEIFGQPSIIPAPEEEKNNNNIQQKAPPNKTSKSGVNI